MLSATRAWGASGGSTVIDATGKPNGILDQANDTTISGFTIENAQLEGILVEPPPSTWPTTQTASPVNVTGVTVQRNVVTHNDCAYDTTATNPFLACLSSPTDSDDCGDGIHLLGTSYSRVIGTRSPTTSVGFSAPTEGSRPQPTPRRSAPRPTM